MSGTAAWVLPLDAAGGKAWAKVYRSLPYIAVWPVGRYGSIHVNEAQTYDKEVTAGDFRETRKLGIGYLPGVWPGSSWTNLTRNRWSTDQFRDKTTCENWTESYSVPYWGHFTL